MTAKAKWRYLEQEEALVCEELGMRISLMKGFLYQRLKRENVLTLSCHCVPRPCHAED